MHISVLYVTFRASRVRKIDNHFILVFGSKGALEFRQLALNLEQKTEGFNYPLDIGLRIKSVCKHFTSRFVVCLEFSTRLILDNKNRAPDIRKYL
jgi:hypothetical protein